MARWVRVILHGTRFMRFWIAHPLCCGLLLFMHHNRLRWTRFHIHSCMAQEEVSYCQPLCLSSTVSCLCPQGMEDGERFVMTVEALQVAQTAYLVSENPTIFTVFTYIHRYDMNHLPRTARLQERPFFEQRSHTSLPGISAIWLKRWWVWRRSVWAPWWAFWPASCTSATWHYKATKKRKP